LPTVKLHLFVEQVSHGFAHGATRIERGYQSRLIDGLTIAENGFAKRFLNGP
jgi:hypothetical protein